MPCLKDQIRTVQKPSTSNEKEVNKDLDADDLDFSDLTMDQTTVEEEKPKQLFFMLTGIPTSFLLQSTINEY